jgi:NAD(P)-dependent dehydrogenase (short-subunit alcohol dehydrogenase family)
MIEWWKEGKFVPMGRLGRDEEIAWLCVFLASDLTTYMNGQVVVLDGGGLAGGHVPTGFAPVVPLPQEVSR